MSKKDRSKGLNFLKDTSSAYINIPCGYCVECVKSKQMQIVQRVQNMCLDHHVFFCTLTYMDSMIPSHEFHSYDIDSGEEVQKYIVKYADIADFQDMVKRIRKYELFPRHFYYLVVSELGSKRGRPHFHALFFIPKYKDDTKFTCWTLEEQMKNVIKSEWKRNVAVLFDKVGNKVLNKDGSERKNTRNPEYKPLSKFDQRFVQGRITGPFDFHYVESSLTSDDTNVAFYVTKYMVKPSERAVRLQRALKLNLDEDEYKFWWPKIRPKFVFSKGVGVMTDLQKDFIRSSVHASIRNGKPQYLALNGSTWPLARYFMSKGDLFTVDDAIKFFDQDVIKKNNDGMVFDDKSFSSKIAKSEHYKDMVRHIDDNDIMSNI